MKNKILVGFMAIIFAGIFSSCGKVPQAEIDAANAAIDSARLAGAEMYLPEAFTAVQDSMNAVMEEIEAQKSRLIASYGDAKGKLTLVTTMANDLVGKTEARIAELKAEIQAKLAEVNVLIEENKQLVTRAPKGKEGAAALTVIKAEIGAIEASLGEITSLFDSGDYLNASVKVNAAQEKAGSINQELKDAIAKAGK